MDPRFREDDRWDSADASSFPRWRESTPSLQETQESAQLAALGKLESVKLKRVPVKVTNTDQLTRTAAEMLESRRQGVPEDRM
ncbi:MAG: hypothetical protein ABI035_00320 [Gemmatimonadaceae bacterium]